MQKVFNADILMENADNFVRAEHITNIVPNNPYYVVHSIYFAESLTVFEDAMQKKRLILNVDYEYASMDSVASELSNKDCYRALIFLKDIPQAYIDYHSYGDLVSAELLNDLNDMTEKLKQQTEILTQKVVSLTDELNTHRNDTAPHGAQESAVPRALALRSASGTLQAAEATDEKELTTLGQTLRSIKAAKEALLLALKKTKEETLEIVAQLFTRLIDNAPEDLNTLKKLATLASENKQHIASHQLILESRMPLNPVAAYDMADVQPKTIFQQGHFESTGKYLAKELYDLSAYKGKKIRITVSGYRKGDGGYPEVFIYDQDWKFAWSSGGNLGGTSENTMADTVAIPNMSGKIVCALYHLTSDKMHNTIVLTACVIETISGQPIIDSSGNGNHATISGDVMQVKDVAVGDALSFTRGSLTRAPLDCIGVGKKWSHSRWIKINEHTQDKTVNTRPWIYGQYDYAIMDIAANSGTVGNFVLACYKDEHTGLFIDIEKARIIDDRWHHLVVMTDLQGSYCWRCAFLDGQKIAEKRVDANFKNFPSTNECSEMASLTGSLANLFFFDRLLTEGERLWLYRNPYYPAKRYSLAEYKADENRRLIEALQQNTSLFVPKSAFELSGTTLSIKM